jgi:error-prone DNA polymerase
MKLTRAKLRKLIELRYQNPAEVVPGGSQTASFYLCRLTYEGAGRRWPHGMPAKVQLHQIELACDAPLLERRLR